MLKDKNVLIAGGEGFVGKNLALRLLSLGAKVTITSHKKNEDEKSYYDGAFNVIPCDLTNKEHCERIVQDMDYIFMCAAVTHGAAFMQNKPTAIVTPTLIMNALMLEASYNAKVKKFIFISSSTVYPDTFEIPTKESDVNEGEPHDKYYGVGWMKRYVEILCKLYSEKVKNPMQTIVIRPSNMIGPYDDFNPETSHVAPALIRKVIECKDEINIWGNGEDVRDLIYIDDFIDGMLLAAEQDTMYNPINIGSGETYTVTEILGMLLEIADKKIHKINYDITKPTMIPVRRIDCTKAMNELGFKAKTSTKEALRKTYNWYKETYCDNNTNTI